MGDSLTYGFGLPRAQVWTALCAARTCAELVNRGVNGNTTGGMLAGLGRELDSLKPDAVVLMGGGNDLIYGGDLAGAKANMGAMVHLAAASSVLPIVGVPPAPCPPIRRDWAAWADSERIRGAQGDYQAWLRELTQIFHLPLMDFAAGFSARADGRGQELRGYYMEDGLHPNGAGHELMAQIASAAVLDIIRKGRR